MKKMFEVLENFNCGLLRSLDFWNKPESPTWRGKSGDEYIHYELTKANFKEYDTTSFNREEHRQQYLERIKAQWLAKCAQAFKEEDKRAGIDPGIVEATDYQTLARKSWDDGDFEAKYLAQLDHYCHKLSSLANLWSKIIPVVVLIFVLVVAGIIWDMLNRSNFEAGKQRLMDAYATHLAAAQNNQSFLPQIRDIYQTENTDTAEARLAFLAKTSELFRKGVNQSSLNSDEETLNAFLSQRIENVKYADGEGFWFLKKMKLPVFSDSSIGEGLTQIMKGQSTGSGLFDYLDKLHPYTDIEEGEFLRLKLMHDLASVDAADPNNIDRHFNSIKSQVSDLKQAGHLVGDELKIVEAWLDSGCSPEDAGNLLTPTLNPLQASKLVNAINTLKCAKYCDRLTACRNAGGQEQIATCLVESIQALLAQNVNLNRELLEYVKFRSAILVLQDKPDLINRMFFDEKPEFSQLPGKTFTRPSGTCPEFGEPCDMIPTDKVVEEFAATVALLDALALRKGEYHKFFTYEAYEKIKNAFPDLTIIPGERNLWSALEKHVKNTLSIQMKSQADELLGADKWTDAFEVYRALMTLNDKVRLMETSDEITAQLLMCALAVHYDHPLKAAPEDAPQFIKKFANGDHGFFMQSSASRLGSENQKWFRTHLQGKRLVKDHITVKSPTIDKIIRYL